MRREENAPLSINRVLPNIFRKINQKNEEINRSNAHFFHRLIHRRRAINAENGLVVQQQIQPYVRPFAAHGGQRFQR